VIAFYRTVVMADLVSWCFLAFVAILALALWRTPTRRTRIAVVALFAILWIIASPAASRAVVWPLRWPADTVRSPADARGANTIVVLGGGVVTYRAGGAELPALSYLSAMRVLEAARVSRLLPDAAVLSSGGRPIPERHSVSEARMMSAALISVGVPAERIMLEDTSNNTYEQALNVARLLGPRRADPVILVTSSWHMLRALRTFEAAGLTCIPSAAADQSDNARGPWLLLPSFTGLISTQMILGEYAALAYYWGKGRLSAPAP
jgi:uncharacterized SAM-binding protein YcdF (DUF218 family)